MNPVADFTSDNNGTIISLPVLPSGGQATATGQLTFGVGTQQNNALPSTANIVPLDQNGYFTTSYMCTTSPMAQFRSPATCTRRRPR
jgi:hypothetical protein